MCRIYGRESRNLPLSALFATNDVTLAQIDRMSDKHSTTSPHAINASARQFRISTSASAEK